MGPRPNGTRGMGARHAICSLEIKLVSEQENEEGKTTHGAIEKLVERGNDEGGECAS